MGPLIMSIISLVAMVIGMIAGSLVIRREFKKMHDRKDLAHQPPIINVDLGPIHKALEQVPARVLTAVTSSSNNLKGNLGELIGYLKLNAQYDRVIPLGNIVDFICISLPKEGREGHIDFVDIKTGGSAKLSRDQSQLKKLIEEKKIQFIKMKLEATTEPEGA